MTGIPVVNVNNNCSTGSSALFLANTAVKFGQTECSLALGFERMKPGSLGSNWPDRKPAMAVFNECMADIEKEGLGENHGPNAPRMFADGAQEYFNKYGGNMETLAKIGTFVFSNSDYRLMFEYSLQKSQALFEQPLLTVPRRMEC